MKVLNDFRLVEPRLDLTSPFERPSASLQTTQAFLCKHGGRWIFDGPRDLPFKVCCGAIAILCAKFLGSPLLDPHSMFPRRKSLLSGRSNQVFQNHSYSYSKITEHLPTGFNISSAIQLAPALLFSSLMEHTYLRN